ncbi:MAG: hypothetical protein CVU44_21875 [Chloroflexi bacterium HGW-Chloroflexi-6]|nr:MAG: hypothetical protein CVU44_21875 [Chloroflexi bacterium HGW-Chloroflexi-6]
MKPSFKNSSMLVLIMLALFVSALGAIPARAAGPLYVTPDGTGNCSSWASACNLQTALGNAVSGDEIWVAAGTYIPHASDRAVSFELKNGVAIYGGFAGTETTRDQRDLDANKTILSGDLVGDDADNVAHDEPTRAENSLHVVVGSGTDNTAVLDGFTVTGGNANDEYDVPCNLGCGGGMYNFSGSPTLRNVVFSANSTAYDGGGIYNWSSSPALTNVTFSSNSAGNQGGGIFNVNNSNPTLTYVNIIANSAYEGGGMLNYLSVPTLTNVIFSGNSASLDGGGMWNGEGNPTLTNITFSDNAASSMGGGMFNAYSSPALLNVTFSANSAGSQGGGMYNFESNPTLTNVTITGSSGGGLYSDTSSPTLKNVIIANTLDGGDCAPENGPEEESSLNVASSHNLIQDEFNACGLMDGVNGNIIGSDPLLGALADNGGLAQTHALLPGSPAIDAGDGTVCPAVDQRGVARDANCDMGAFEFEHDSGVRYAVPSGGMSSGQCDSWKNACSLQTAIATAVGGDEIWVAAGTYIPHASDRAVSFTLKNGVAIYGGFDGTETARDHRDFDANETILSGDLSGNDNDNVAYYEPTRAENSYHVVVGSVTDETAVLDGFIVTGGNANGSWSSPCGSECGGGLYNLNGDLTLKNVIFTANSANRGGGMANWDGGSTLVNVTFSANSSNDGGGMFNWNSSPTLTNVTFKTNSANFQNGSGGGVANYSSSNLTLTDVSFLNNSAMNGGGMSCTNCTLILTKVIFDTNTASWSGGGMDNNAGYSPVLTDVIFLNNIAKYGGGMRNFNSSPTLTNVTFSNNSASNGGGMYNAENSDSMLSNVTFNANTATQAGGGMKQLKSSPVLANVTFSANSADEGGGMYNFENSSPTLTNVVIANSTNGGDCLNGFGAALNPSSSHNLIEDAASACGLANGLNGNITGADALLGPLADNGGFTLIHSLLAGSPAIDAGASAGCPATDQRGLARPRAGGCDIGAYEFNSPFADVAETYWAFSFVERLFAAGITGGCGNAPLTYCPEKPVTRAQMAVFLLKGIHGKSYTPPLVGDGTGFADVPASHWAAAWIKQLAAEGITGGCGAGNYCPENPVTRAQMAVFLLKAQNGSSYSPPVVGAETGFGDVAVNYWAAAWIKQLAAEGITGGCGAGNYCPENPVTRAQMAVFLVRAFSLP